MEVHHHPDFRVKNFKEYIFEGLMIFMAVTMGFFAEKLRENTAEHTKEKEFIVSMIEDAQTDIININDALAWNKIRVLKLDTLSECCFYYGNPGRNDAVMYKVLKSCIRHPDFVAPVERTMMQLKYSAGMRLIKSPVAVNSIINYDHSTKKLVNQQDYYELHLKVLLDASEQLFNLKYYPLNAKTMLWENDTAGMKKAQLINHNMVKITEYGNKAKIFQGIVMFYITRLNETKQQAQSLIESLKQEYHIH